MLRIEYARQAAIDHVSAFQAGVHALFSADADDAERERRRQRDRLAWQAASGAGTVAALQAYLQQFPEGEYTSLAHNRVTELRAAAEQARQHAAAEREAQSRQLAMAAPKPLPRAAPAAPAVSRFDGDWSGDAYYEFTGGHTSKLEAIVTVRGDQLEVRTRSTSLWGGGVTGYDWRTEIAHDGSIRPAKTQASGFIGSLNLSGALQAGGSGTLMISGCELEIARAAQ